MDLFFTELRNMVSFFLADVNMGPQKARENSNWSKTLEAWHILKRLWCSFYPEHFSFVRLKFLCWTVSGLCGGGPNVHLANEGTSKLHTKIAISISARTGRKNFNYASHLCCLIWIPRLFSSSCRQALTWTNNGLCANKKVLSSKK